MEPEFRRGTRRASLPRVALVALAALSVAISACSGTGAPAPAAPAAPAGAELRPAAAPTTAPAPDKANQGAAASQAAPSADVIPPSDRMIIRDAKLTLQVQDVEAALARIRAIADTYGGYVTASHTYFVHEGDQDRMVADVTIAVRAASYDQAVTGVRQTAIKVENEDSTSQDVTQQYVDLDAQLRNLQTSENEILKLMDKATTIQDVVTLEQQLSSVRGQIDRIQGQKNYLEHVTTMSTITINLHLPPLQATSTATAGWMPLATFQRGWRASLVALESIADALILVVSFLWWLIPLGVAGGLIYWRTRRRAATT